MAFDIFRNLTYAGEIVCSLTHTGKIALLPDAVGENEIVYTIPDGGSSIMRDGGSTITLTRMKGEGCELWRIDALIAHTNPIRHTFSDEDAVTLRLHLPGGARMTGWSHDGTPWWEMPRFTDSLSGLARDTQQLIWEKEGVHTVFLPLTGEDFRCEIGPEGLHITSGVNGKTSLSGAFLCAAWDEDPFRAMEKAYSFAREKGALRAALRRERQFPKILDGFGFCTWDAFYHDVSQDNILRKLDELKKKDIPVRWMIIDDGWIQNDNSYLTDFAADPVKFPDGLGKLTERVKRDYGVRYVGVWHALEGYWNGIKYGSPVYESQKENLTRTATGLYLPSFDPEKAFRFWDAWHTYLEDSGIDFVKVDNQSSYTGYAEGTGETVRACRAVNTALDRSANKHFRGVIINCMGMDMENVLERPTSPLSRNSDDFFPRRENGFAKHAVQNAYNAVWHDEMYYCDFDMWWSGAAQPHKSGALRAISGSPVYVSDEVGMSDREMIMPVIREDGSLIRCDRAAKPVPELLYTDCIKENKLLRMFNTRGDALVLGVFNVTLTRLSEEHAFSAVPGIVPGKKYLAREYFTGEERVITGDDICVTDLSPDDVRVYTIVPIGDDGRVPEIDRTKYVAV